MNVFPDTLHLGSKGPSVVLVQLLLLAKGCNAERLVVDGEYGRQTADGVKVLQIDLDVPVTGCFDAATRRALARTGSSYQMADLPAEILVKAGVRVPS